MKKRFACPRCGLEMRSSTWRWVDRHPAAAVCAGVFVGLPAGYTLVGIMLIWPWFTIPATIIVCAVLLNRAARKRAAIAARAEWEHREMMVRAVRDSTRRRDVFRSGGHTYETPPRPKVSVPPPAVRARHVLTDWPTTPMLTRPIRMGR